MDLEILDVDKVSLSDEDVRGVVELELHPEARKWDIYNSTAKSTDRNIEKAVKGFNTFFGKVPEDENQLCLIAKLETKVVGWLGIHRLNQPRKHVGEVGMTVHPDYWRKGIGTKLLEAGVSLARGKGLKKLVIEIIVTNKSMRRIAEKTGFQLEGIIRKDVDLHGQLVDSVLYGILL